MALIGATGAAEPLRDRLVSCGATLLAEQGAAGVTLRAIARQAGVSHGAPRRYFPTRSALLSAIAAGGFDTLEQRMAGAAAGASSDRDRDPDPDRDLDRDLDPATGLRRACRAYLDFALDNRGMFELMFRHDLLVDEQPSLRHSGLPAFAAFVGLVRAVQRTGWREAVPPRVLAGALWSSVHGLTQLWLWGALPLATDGHDPGPVLQALLDVYLPPAAGVGPAP